MNAAMIYNLIKGSVRRDKGLCIKALQELLKVLNKSRNGNITFVADDPLTQILSSTDEGLSGLEIYQKRKLIDTIKYLF